MKESYLLHAETCISILPVLILFKCSYLFVGGTLYIKIIFILDIPILKLLTTTDWAHMVFTKLWKDKRWTLFPCCSVIISY